MAKRTRKYSSKSALRVMLETDNLRGFKERVAESSGLYIEGDADFKLQAKKQMFAADAEIRRHEAETARRGFCPHCHMLQTTAGRCSMGCDA
ncbi:MAG TPA: hypothetical protein VFF14_01355 [Candidatus Deferrimicrobium sp.]|nr:hypothetical protein [Candidatus Deferrimicrobium sp.]